MEPNRRPPDAGAFAGGEATERGSGRQDDEGSEGAADQGDLLLRSAGGAIEAAVLNPFQKEPDFKADSVNYNWKELWDQGRNPG